MNGKLSSSRSRDEMAGFEHVLMRTLRYLYDAESQIAKSLPMFHSHRLDAGFVAALEVIERQTGHQSARLEEIFELLYCRPQGQACWAVTALLRDAWECSGQAGLVTTEGCAAAILALLRYQVGLYEALLRWSHRCALDEALVPLRRTIAEKLLQAAIIARFAYHDQEGEFDDPLSAQLTH